MSVVGAVDMCAIATKTFQDNFPKAHVVNKKLERIRPAQLRDKIGDIDLLLASPECTNHTCAKGSALRSEASRETAWQVLRFAKAFEPRWIVMENVVHMRPWHRYVELIDALKSIGYQISEQVLDSANFGVPQKRRRLFVICDREGEPPKVVPTNGVKTPWVRDILDPDGTWKTTPLLRPGRAMGTKARAERAIAELGGRLNWSTQHRHEIVLPGFYSLASPEVAR